MSPPDGPARAGTRTGLDPQLSARIGAARVICILALVFVHVPPWAPQLGDPPRQLALFDYLYVFLCEGLSRNSVPLLSIISGYLLVVTGHQRGHATLLVGKVRSLLLPLLLWNLVSAGGRAATGTLEPTDPLGWMDRLIAFSGTPLVVPLYFLRDIFLCVVVAPALVWLLRRRAGLTLALIAALAVFGLLDGALINPLIAVFFAAGCAIGLGRFPIRSLPAAPLLLAAFVVVALFTTLHVVSTLRAPQADGARWFANMLLLVQRATGALFFWHVAGLSVRSTWGQWIMRLEPFIFFHFCAHTLILGAIFSVLTSAGVEYGNTAYILYFLTAPLTSLALALAAATALRAVAPWLAQSLCGGRLPSWGVPRAGKSGAAALKAT